MNKEIKTFLSRMSKEFKTEQDEITFLINNYNDMILTLKGLDPQYSENYKEYYDEYDGLLNGQITSYINVELDLYFDKLMTFVREFDSKKDDIKSDLAGNQVKIKGIVVDFSKSWKESIDGMNKDISNNFLDGSFAIELLKQILNQLTMMYAKFQEIIKQLYPRGNPFAKDMVSIPTIMYEIKKYK